MILIPLFWTFIYLLAIIAGLYLLFGDKVVDYQYTLKKWWQNIGMSVIGTVLMMILEGHFGTWTTVYVVSSCIEIALGIFRVGKRRILSEGYGVLILIESFFWLWVVWHVYSSR